MHKSRRSWADIGPTELYNTVGLLGELALRSFSSPIFSLHFNSVAVFFTPLIYFLQLWFPFCFPFTLDFSGC